MSNKKKSLFSSSGSVELGVPLIMEVNTEDLSSANSTADSIILPFDEGNTVNLQIDWGDGTPLEPYTDTNLICTHQYALGGFYDIKIYNLNGVSRIPWNITNVASNRRDYSKFYDLKQFGDCEIYQLSLLELGSFQECQNLDITASDIGERCVELSTIARYLFRDTAIVEAKNSANWDTSNITSFEWTFLGVTNIIIDVSNWEMSQVTNLYATFTSCGNINPDVTNWDISNNCTTIRSLFANLPNFERNLSNWDVSGVNTMFSTFLSCTSFTGQGLDTWVTSALTNLGSTFQSCTSLTTVNLSSWDVSGVTTMSSTFNGCTNFVGNGLNSWATTSALTSLSSTFRNCINFDVDLSNWDVSGVTGMVQCFRGCDSFTGQGLDTWVTSSLKNLQQTFQDCNSLTTVNLSNWDVSGVTTMNSMFTISKNFVGNGLENWVTTDLLTNLSSVFNECTNFNGNLQNFDVSGVTTMSRSFLNCTNFVGNGLENWITTSVLILENTFNNCINFNIDLSGWDFSNVTNMNNFGRNWGMDTNNYDKLLLSLKSQTLQPNLTNVAMSSKYTAGEVTNGVTDSISTNKLIDSTQNFTSTVNVGDVIFNTTQDIYAEVVTVDSNTELTLDADIMALGDSYSVEGSDVAKARYFVVKTYNWQIIDDGQAPAANTFIGGVGNVTISNVSELATTLGVQESEIFSFNIDSNNTVSFYIDAEYGNTNTYRGGSDLTTFLDLDGKYNLTQTAAFSNESSLTHLYIPSVDRTNLNANTQINLTNLERININGLIDLAGRGFLNNASSLKTLRLNAVTGFLQGGSQSYYNCRDLTTLERLYIPNLTNFNTTSLTSTKIGGQFENINPLCKVYYNSSLGTQVRNSFNTFRFTGGGITVGDTFTIDTRVYTAIAGTPTQDGDFQVINNTIDLSNFQDALINDTRAGASEFTYTIVVANTLLINAINTGSQYDVSCSVGSSNVGASDFLYENSFVGGNDLHPMLIYMRERGCTVVEVNNIISVPAPTNLSVTNLNNGSYQLDFTEPTPNANGTELYEVWAEALDNPSNPKNYFYYDTISASGDSISGLDVNTRYKITVRTQDGQMQFSGFSNEITITTNQTSADIISNLVQYNPLINNSISIIGVNGTDTDVSYGDFGDFQNTANFNQSTSLINLGNDSNLSIGNGVVNFDFTISVRVKFNVVQGSIFIDKRNTSFSEYILRLRTGNVTINGRVSNEDGTLFDEPGALTNPLVNEWLWVVFRGDSQNVIINVYDSNGILKDSESLPRNTTQFNTTAELLLGAAFNSGLFNGSLGEFALWKGRILNDEDITKIKNNYNNNLPLSNLL